MCFHGESQYGAADGEDWSLRISPGRLVEGWAEETKLFQF